MSEHGGMTVQAMELRLVLLSEAWIKDRDVEARDEYRRLHPVWVKARKDAES